MFTFMSNTYPPMLGSGRETGCSDDSRGEGTDYPWIVGYGGVGSRATKGRVVYLSLSGVKVGESGCGPH